VREEKEIIHSFGDYLHWVESLGNIKERIWSTPVSENKWPVSAIVAHLLNWDKYLLHEVLPTAREGRGVTFPDFDSFNRLASDYINSGVTRSDLIKEALDARVSLIRELNEMPADMLTLPLTANGVSHCPHTGTPYSLIYIIKEFTDHDLHHKDQIMRFIKRSEES